MRERDTVASSMAMSSAQHAEEEADLDWQAVPLTEEVVALKAAPESRLLGSPGGSLSPRTGGMIMRQPSATPKKVFARLCKNNPYIGFFHYSPR